MNVKLKIFLNCKFINCILLIYLIEKESENKNDHLKYNNILF